MVDNSSTPLPGKATKKRRAFLEDDFFVIKKNKKTRPLLSSLSEREKSTTPLSTADKTRSVPALSSADTLDSDSPLQSFHSATDILPDRELPADCVDAQSEANSADKENAMIEVPSISDDLDVDLDTFFKEIKMSHSGAASATAGESARIYVIKVISRYGMPLETEVAVSGDTTFGSMLVDLEINNGQEANWGSDGVLLWVEGRSELKRFFKPSTLRIPAPNNGAPTMMTVLHMPPQSVDKFDAIFAEFSKKADAEEVIELSDSSETRDSSPDTRSAFSGKEDFFVVGLKGKDNKRIECEVGPETKIRSLLTYYMEVKKIDPSASLNSKLIFDDEELDLDGLVKDTELEDEFEVQVYI